MNIKLTSLFSAVALALVATTSSSFAKVYTPATFKKELTKKLGKKTGAAAISTASAFLKQALSDSKNTKSVVAFASATTAALKKPVAASLKVSAATKVANALTTGYFKKGTYNPTDSKYASALKNVVSKLVTVKSQKTPATGKAIYTSVYSVKKTANTPAFQEFLNMTIYKALGLKEWPVS